MTLRDGGAAEHSQNGEQERITEGAGVAHTGGAWQLHLGDCAAPEGLASLATSSVGALVTDPPAGIGFMAKEWDGDKGGRQGWVGWLTGIMRECLRVLKPGAHGLVWALPRTSHWTATALEDAGFEIRDVVTHHFGTGFPKSLDVSKAIDTAAGAEREVVGRNPNFRAPTSDHHERWNNAVLSPHATTPATPAAKQWAGWGTALKPASEHWILVRKPLDGTVAANVQRHGTGALNIDGCRIEGAPRNPGFKNPQSAGIWNGADNRALVDYESPAGRWPANLVLSHGPECGETCAPGCPVAELDAQSGNAGGGYGVRGRGSKIYADGKGYANTLAEVGQTVGYGDEGGASRFFYCAKPSRDERDAGCASLPIRSGGEATGRKDGSAALSSPRTGAGRGGGARNDHPTVKPTDLMEWLIRLITPPGATLLVLDPFAGSGTTGVAAIRLHQGFVGWEREPGYHAIATKRLEAAAAEPEQLGLFGERRSA